MATNIPTNYYDKNYYGFGKCVQSVAIPVFVNF